MARQVLLDDANGEAVLLVAVVRHPHLLDARSDLLAAEDVLDVFRQLARIEGLPSCPHAEVVIGNAGSTSVLVEQTGFEYDIVMDVFDGRTGEQLYTDNFKDFKQFEGESVDPLQGMFENLRALEDRITGVFSQKEVETSRILLTN